ncbi:glycosyltransferase [Nonomuraea endophytica]|uniref:Glycosyltransferase involved in cell wall biosynthesis n=1 Tax=Nonomuraea endophytica TaxID=714136 RepID=A0A7W8A068_9ACTN|nr:glycosyltransferase [Nonomuraea endophytica]MBB5076431.1 glycosyltransferase involved in cell wall biosynthesis [Nonomuraea endophytica]
MARTYGFLSTHPPTRCGLATFNSALAAHLAQEGGIVRVIADGDDDRPLPEVVHTWSPGGRGGWQAAAAALEQFDVAIVQHEYGIYPGANGEDVLPLLRGLAVPSVVVLHTVLARPTPQQKDLLEEIAAAAGAVVTMTGTARDRLLTGYKVDAGKVFLIPHGTADHRRVPSRRQLRPHLLTWGLIGPGKGLEWALRALALLDDVSPTYTIAGRTHPKVLESQGEAYRAGLYVLANRLGVAPAVRHDPVYRDQRSLSRLVRSADVVVLPYDSTEQVTSGVLIEAVAAGVPVVATEFPHAVELLTDGPGLIVPHADPVAMAAAVRRVLTEPGLADELAGRTRSLVSSMLWPAVAARYEDLVRMLVAERPAAVAAAIP